MTPFESHKNGTYQNLVPVLELSDLEQFDCWNNIDVQPYDEVFELAKQVRSINSNIDDAIMYDFNLFEQEQNADNESEMSQEEISNYIDGLMEGYEFMIGITTKINMVRRNITRFENYVNLSVYYPGFIPLKDINELKYFTKTLSGDAPLELTSENSDVDSEDLLIEQYGEFINESPRFETAVSSVKNSTGETLDIIGCTEQEIEAHFQGFERGLIHCFGMYLFSTQDQIFKSHW